MARQRTGGAALEESSLRPKFESKNRKKGSAETFLFATGRALDFALEGPGFFVVEAPAGRRLTRWGHFYLDGQRRLCTGEGHAVAGEQGLLALPPGALTVTPTGDLRVNRQRTGTLALVLPVAPAPAPKTFVRQGYLEISAGEVAGEMGRSFYRRKNQKDDSPREGENCG